MAHDTDLFDADMRIWTVGIPGCKLAKQAGVAAIQLV